MQKIYGFVAEFNPFHNGHKLFIDEIKQKFHPDVLIAVMSGNYVQRGDFAILDKWQRARIAVENGVDLVVELPFAYAVEPADLFAKGAVMLLDRLKVNNLVFGTETDLNFESVASQMLKLNMDFRQDYQNNYATNLTEFYKQSGVDVLGYPNQLLGINYVQQVLKNAYSMKINTIIRQGSISATKIRQNFHDGIQIGDLVPESSLSALKNDKIISWDDSFPYLKYRILSESSPELHRVYQMVEGLENKFKKEISHDSFSEFLDSVKSKRYTRSRLRRLALYTLMNVYGKEISAVYEEPYLRVLGFDQIGQNYLNELRKDSEFIVRVGKNERNTLSLDLKADSIRKLIDSREQNFGKIPFMEGKD
ncbi:nucleotidyltransferase family protein [Companilactobacillus keshanensis]|uniref:tRNA(Met) cytidine acetate ligase n=1 Tax=Companilactobacillus keshanensis TaxID=2486003 RepID=A0ABW4BRU0_9LACO|nr:nucleotidyltransferase family protein [Companilactobacillus keshanensis]